MQVLVRGLILITKRGPDESDATQAKRTLLKLTIPLHSGTGIKSRSDTVALWHLGSVGQVPLEVSETLRR
jgi:hypothetical protein